jgi:hypothetical protein
MAPKKNPQRDHPDHKPSGKGKQRAEAPSHHDEGDPADPSNRPSGSDQHFPPPKKKSKRQKQREEEEVEGELSSDDSLLRDMGGPDPRKGLVDHFLKLPWATTTVNPGSNTIGARAGPSTMDMSPLPSPATQWCDDFSSSTSSLLQPPVRDDNLSSASSRGSKRCQEPSPPRLSTSHFLLTHKMTRGQPWSPQPR